jgi:hypothetical protein
MATKKTAVVGKISDKLVRVNENFNVYMYDNGYMFEIGGKDAEGDWKTAKIMCATLEQLVLLVQEAADMDRDD